MIYFISDLHLSPQTPGVTAIFTRFLRNISQPGNSLYILGDLFEAWIGDDDQNIPGHQEIITALAQANATGLSVFVMHGNRDFLLGEDFCQQSGAKLLPDPYTLSTPEWQFILSHGDALCTHDEAYQKFRQQTRTPEWKSAFLAKPLDERRAMAVQLRQQSKQETNQKSLYIMDLNLSDTDDFLRQHGYATFIHGHTHQPAQHDHMVDGIHVERWVLSDWHEDRGECLTWDGKTLTRQTLYPECPEQS